MWFGSTRDCSPRATLDQALQAGLAPDGGLFVPMEIPGINRNTISPDLDLPECAARVLAPYFEHSRLADRLPAICRQALDIDLPLNALHGDPKAWVMELFHGPTAAFKDFAARFLAACLDALSETRQSVPKSVQTVLVATSGDTGAAVAAAFHGKPGFRVVIVYPDGRVSARQAHQLGAFGDNIHAFRVQGDFDDCQRMVKHLLATAESVQRYRLTSANSISIGRLLPQISYYALAASSLASCGSIDFIVPTGNLGNALACILAREMGFPIATVTLATNANRTLPDFFSGNDYRGRPGLQTLANAMDVGDPSNFERLAWIYRDRDPRDAAIRAESVDDAAIQARIQTEYRRHGQVICPHTACAMEVLRRLRNQGHDRPVVVAATAHPAKFEQVIEPLIGQTIQPPPELARLLQRPARAEAIAPEPAALERALEGLDHA